MATDKTPEGEGKRDRIVYLELCPICENEISRQDPRAWICVRYKTPGDVGSISVHSDCVRPLFSDYAQSLLDPDRVASDADGLGP